MTVTTNINDRVMFLLNQKDLHLGIDLESLTKRETARSSNKGPGRVFSVCFSIPYHLIVDININSNRIMLDLLTN